MINELRRRLARLLVRLAFRIYKQSPEVKQFWLETMTDAAILGRTITRVQPTEAWDYRMQPYRQTEKSPGESESTEEKGSAGREEPGATSG